MMMVSSMLLHGSSVLTEAALHHLTSLNTLHSLEQVEHFHFVNSTVPIGITLLHGLVNLLLIVGRSHAHGEGKVSVGHEELLTLKTTRVVFVVSLENLLDILLKFLIMLIVPSS